MRWRTWIRWRAFWLCVWAAEAFIDAASLMQRSAHRVIGVKPLVHRRTIMTLDEQERVL